MSRRRSKFEQEQERERERERQEISTMTDYKDKTPRYLFSGKKEDYATWNIKYGARSAMKGFRKLIEPNKDSRWVLRKQSQIATETDVATKTLDEKIQEMNAKGFNDLLLSIDTSTSEGEVAFMMVVECRDDDYPEGNLAQAFDKLSAEYAPTSITAYIEMKSEYTKRVLMEGENPTI